VTGVCGVFYEPVRAWEGMIATHYSDQLSTLDGGYGVKLETGAIQPGLIASSAPWRGGAQFRSLMAELEHTLPLVVFLRDRGSGEVRVDREGQPVVHYRLSRYDARHLRAGAGGVERLLADADACGWGPGQISLSSVHSMSSARMGDSPRRSACDPSGTTWDVRQLVVCDGSALPNAPGVNPMVSIEAVAHMNARRLAERIA
jgi:long-chain-alcohol oxidase